MLRTVSVCMDSRKLAILRENEISYEDNRELFFWRNVGMLSIPRFP